jgi:DNA-binding HxlR family transcriptional regulator
MRQIKRRSDCRISFALDIFGDKWTLLILRDLMLRRKSYYGDFLESEEKIATNILADRLQVLEHTGIIKKSRDPQNKTKYRYRLTRKGLDLLPILVETMVWGAKYAPKTGAKKNPVMRDLTLRALQDKFALMRDIIKDVEKNQLGLV